MSDYFEYGVVVCGSEILSGKRKDKHFEIITHAFKPRGMQCRRFMVIGDKYDDLTDTIEWCFEHYPLTLVTGGLGPTADDITRECIVEATGIPLIENPAIIHHMEERFRNMGRELKPNNRTQALVPKQGGYFHNHHGTAPGLYFDNGEKVVIALPGPPRELNPMLNDQVVPYLEPRFGVKDRSISRSFYFCGLGESEIDHHLRPELESHPEVELSSLAHYGMIDITLTMAENTSTNQRVLDELGEFLRRTFGEFLYSETYFLLEECVGNLLQERGQSVAVAESCTGGLLGAKLTTIPGSSAYFQGGIMAYSNEVKQRELGVDAGVLQEQGAVSEAVAAQLAQGVRRRFDTDWGIGITGVAGPGGGSDEKPVGTVWIAVADKNDKAFPFCVNLPGTRAWVRQRACVYALDQLRRCVLGLRAHLRRG